jgi:hypothetical protein
MKKIETPEETKMRRNIQRGYRGEYKGQFTRSTNEYVYCVYLDVVKDTKFITEPISLKSAISNKRKIPDVMYYDRELDIVILTEIKQSEKEIAEIFINYTLHEYMSYDVKELVTFDFVLMNKVNKKKYISCIESVIGKEKWKEMFDAYLEKGRHSTDYKGFAGELNPNFGLKMSDEWHKSFMDAIADRDYTGSKNPNYGKNHTDEAKKNIGAKWKDPVKKKQIVISGYRTHITKMTLAQQEIYLKYAETILSGGYYKRPEFINRTYGVRKEKIEEYFNSTENFTDCIKEIICQK